jgi:hypothetical protein
MDKKEGDLGLTKLLLASHQEVDISYEYQNSEQI